VEAAILLYKSSQYIRVSTCFLATLKTNRRQQSKHSVWDQHTGKQDLLKCVKQTLRWFITTNNTASHVQVELNFKFAFYSFRNHGGYLVEWDMLCESMR